MKFLKSYKTIKQQASLDRNQVNYIEKEHLINEYMMYKEIIHLLCLENWF